MPLSRSPLRLLAGGEPVAFAVHLQDVDMMEVEQGTREPFRAEYGSPFIERQVALRRLIEVPEEISEFASGTAKHAQPVETANI